MRRRNTCAMIDVSARAVRWRWRWRRRGFCARVGETGFSTLAAIKPPSPPARCVAARSESLCMALIRFARCSRNMRSCERNPNGVTGDTHGVARARARVRARSSGANQVRSAGRRCGVLEDALQVAIEQLPRARARCGFKTSGRARASESARQRAARRRARPVDRAQTRTRCERAGRWDRLLAPACEAYRFRFLISFS